VGFLGDIQLLPEVGEHGILVRIDLVGEHALERGLVHFALALLDVGGILERSRKEDAANPVSLDHHAAGGEARQDHRCQGRLDAPIVCEAHESDERAKGEHAGGEAGADPAFELEVEVEEAVAGDRVHEDADHQEAP
jgi:hypothetical protein